MSRRLVVVVLTLGLLLTGCFNQPVSTSTGIGIGGTGGLYVEMWASTGCTQPGATVHLRAKVANKSNKSWTVELKDRPVFDIETESDGKTVHWSDGKPLSETSRLELKPGESKTLEMDIVIPKYAKYGIIGAAARYIYSPKFADYPARPFVVIHVDYCSGLE